MNQDAIKLKVQKYVVSVSVLLLACKFLAFFITNSVGILTDAMESIVNVAAGFISLYSIRMSSRPKDKGHPFGHGKVELISASLEALLIVLAGGMIVYEGVRRLFLPTEIARLGIGIWIVAAAGAVNFLMGWISIRIGRRYESIALVAGGRHLQSDTYSSIGLVAGLILLHITGIGWIDSALALVFGSVIIVTGVRILIRTIANLTDKADTELLQHMVRVIASSRKPDWIDVHNMKIIRYGSYLYVDCDLTVPWYYDIRQGHDASDELRAIINREFSGRVLFSIHSDPCKDSHCPHCEVSDCPHRQSPFVEPFLFTLTELTKSDEERKEDSAHPGDGGENAS